MVEFETLDMREVDYGNNNFIEISKKKVISEDGERWFISIAKGYYKNNEKRYTQTVTLPNDQEIIGKVIEDLEKLEEV